jgi:hypothetical protein
MSRSIRSGMDSFVGGLQSATHFWSASRAPLDTYGAHPIPPLLSRSLEEISNVLDEGAPLSLSQLVGVAYHAGSLSHKAHNRLFDKPGYIDAVTNIGGTIDDRKFLVRSSSCLTTVCCGSFFCFTA